MLLHMLKLKAENVIKKYAPEYLQEFEKATLAEADEDFYTFVGDKHYFEFELIENDLKLLDIPEIIYW